MTNQTQKTRILEAIQETQRYITKEGSRSDSLRTEEAQKTLDFYKAHMVKLVAMLEAA